MSQKIRLRDLASRRWLACAAALAIGLPAPALSGMIDKAVMQVADASSTPASVPTAEPAAKAAPEAAPEPAVTAAGEGTTGNDAAAPASLAPPAPKTDIYAARTNKILKSEKAGDEGTVHPLQLRFPDYDVTVCTAGCAPGGKIVFKKRKTDKQVAESGEMVPSKGQADRPSDQTGNGPLACLAGCYTTAKAYRSVEKRVDLVAAPGIWPQDGATKKPSMGSGDWMKKINSDRNAGSPGE